jgi:hypothetical protein
MRACPGLIQLKGDSEKNLTSMSRYNSAKRRQQRNITSPEPSTPKQSTSKLSLAGSVASQTDLSMVDIQVLEDDNRDRIRETT